MLQTNHVKRKNPQNIRLQHESYSYLRKLGIIKELHKCKISKTSGINIVLNIKNI